MADDTVAPDHDRKAWIGMQRGIVLDLRALAEFDPFVVAAQHRSEPHARIRLEAHAPDDGRALGNPVALRKVWPLAVELKNSHTRAPIFVGARPCHARDRLASL